MDDEANNRVSLSRRLERRGYEVETAEGASEALDKLFRAHYDLVLLDQMMPEMSGLDLLRLLRATYSETELPVIMVTALDENQAMAEALEEGANDYVLKPVEMPDITARIQTQLKRAKSRRRREPSDAVWDWDPRSGTAHYSEEWADLLGCSTEALCERLAEWLDRIHPGDLVRVHRELKVHLEGATSEFRSEHRLRRNDGSYRWMVMQGVALRDADCRLMRVAGSLSDLPRSHAADQLTGLLSRSQLIARMSDMFRNATPSAQFAVLLIDLDDFRSLNEHAGHQGADEVLLEVSVRLRNVLSEQACVSRAALARAGSDEFAILAEWNGEAGCAASLAKRVLACFADPIRVGNEELTVCGSVGVALGSRVAEPDRLLRDADLALRQAQRQGRGLSWSLFEPGLRNRAHMRATLARDLHHAVERGQLMAFYQPKVELRTGVVRGFEALMRWRHPEFGIVAPSDFIPLAEENGAILGAGEWIVREACRQLAEWRKLVPHLRMSVNLSPRQISDPNLLPMVLGILAETGNDTSALALELTETSLIEEEEIACRVLGEMRRLGVRLMLDDFGTGYASLSYLKVLRFDALKIDRSFVSQLESDEHSAAIIRTILGLARELRMDVVAEGVETEAQLRMLIDMGCRLGQGHYFSRPLEAAHAEEVLARGFVPLPESIPA